MVRGWKSCTSGTYNRFRKALGELPYELPDQEELKDLAAPFFHFELRGGEGHMLIGQSAACLSSQESHMTCELSPYSCMPNTMSVGRHGQRAGEYPDLLYAPIEIKGDAEVHALSRCQMILTEAKKRAQSEFVEAMAQDRNDGGKIRQIEEKHPGEEGDLSHPAHGLCVDGSQLRDASGGGQGGGLGTRASRHRLRASRFGIEKITRDTSLGELEVPGTRGVFNVRREFRTNCSR